MAAVAESVGVPVACGGGVHATTARTPDAEAPEAPGGPGCPVAVRHQGSRAPNIADRYATVLKPLSARQRLGVIAALSVGFYDGWRPTGAELAAYVAAEFGIAVTAPPGRRVGEVHGRPFGGPRARRGGAATPAAMTTSASARHC